MNGSGIEWRRLLGRELSRQNRLTVGEILTDSRKKSSLRASSGTARRIGITGPPGAGKSSLIAALARRRLHRGRAVGVLAVDPTSPISQGSLLGDRVRMDAIADDDRLFIRSVASGKCHDGLCHNVVGMLKAMEDAGFADLILETVGVGQVNYEARKLVDCLVLVLAPESGDTVQAMKAGILEMADIYVVHKADLSGSDRLTAELRSVLQFGSIRASTWLPIVVQASALSGRGVDALDDALDAYHAATANCQRAADLERERQIYQLRALLVQRLGELLEQGTAPPGDDISSAFEEVLSRLPTV